MKRLLVIFLSLIIAMPIFGLVGCKKDNGGGLIIDDDPYEDDGGEVDTTNFDTPETGFVIDGILDETEDSKYVKLGQKYGVEGQMNISYYIGDKGLYFHFDVNDPIVYKANPNENAKDSSPYILESDRVEIFLDTKADATPMSDDYHIMATLEGYNQVLIGNGASFKLDTTYGLDACKAIIKEGTTVTQRNLNATERPQSEKNIDTGYTVEFFMSYKNFGFSKREIYKVSFAQADIWSVIDTQRFNVAGSNTTPNEFRTLSAHGFGTSVALEQGLKIDAVKDDFYTPERVQSDSNLHYFKAIRDYSQNANKGKMTAEAYVYLGQNGLYIYMHAQSQYLKYYYADFPFYSDHVEIRFDVNNSKATEPTADKDKWFFIDILGAVQTAYGIDNETRAAGTYDLIATTAYTGELVDADDVPTRNAGSQDPKTFTFEAFFPWYALNVPEKATFGFILQCGNPNEGSSGIGNVFYPDTDYATTQHWHTFSYYQYYTEFTRP
jgi:hypothetical protein